MHDLPRRRNSLRERRTAKRIGPRGETFTLTSGPSNVPTRHTRGRAPDDGLTVFDSMKSLWQILTSGERRHNIP